MNLDSYRVVSVALGKGAWGEKNTIHVTTNAPTYRRRHRLYLPIHICISYNRQLCQLSIAIINVVYLTLVALKEL